MLDVSEESFFASGGGGPAFGAICPLQGRPIRLAVVVTGAVELVLASDVVDELSDIPDADGGLIPDGFGIDRATILGG